MEVPDTTKANPKHEGGRHSELLCAWQKSSNWWTVKLKTLFGESEKVWKREKVHNQYWSV